MKNLKRVLSLGLTSVMLFGMMVVGASAKDFTDAEDIVHTEAVQTMVALSIINGKEDGSFFDPKGNVTRAEMAKMIAVLMNGGSEANTGVKTTPSFTDIGGHWAEGWIEYCADMQIINGRGDGTFDPNGQVTGTEALKMVLTALGYNAEAYGLIGASWAAQTIERARATQPVKLVDELADVVLTAPATRDTAAQMIWNGLQATAVTTRPEQNKNNGEIIWSYGSANETLLKQRYDADIVKGEYLGNYDSLGNGTCDKGEIAVKATYKYVDEDGNTLTGTTTHKVPSDLSIDNIGEEVKIVYRDSTTKGTRGQADAKDTIYGVFNTGATRVVRSQLSKVKDGENPASGTDRSKDYVNIDGTKYDAKEDVTVYTNFGKTGVSCTSAGKKDSDGTLASVLKKNSGYPIKLTFDDGKVDKIYVTESYIGVVSSMNSTNIIINGNSGVSCNLKIADHDVEDGLEKGDVVVVTPLYNTDPKNSAAKVTVKKADKVSGELVSGKANETLTLDSGKSYKINYQNATKGGKYALLAKSTTIPGEDGTIVDDFLFENNDEIGETFDLYLVNGYVMAAVQTSKSASNYSVITEVKDGTAGATFGGLQIQVLTADGTKEIITVAKDNTDDVNDDGSITHEDFGVGDLITYTFNKDDEAEVNMVCTLKAPALTEYDDKAKTLGTVATSADCVFFAQTKSIDNSPVSLSLERTGTANNKNTDASWKAYKLRDLDGADFKVVASYKNKDGKVVAVVVNDGKTPKGATDNTVYAIISDYSKKEKDYWVFTAQANGETYTIKIKSNSLSKGMLVKFSPTADDTYETVDVKTVKNGVEGTDKYLTGYVKESSANDRTVTFWDGDVAPTGDKANGWKFAPGTEAKTYAIDKDAQIIYVDQKDDKSEAESVISAFTGIDGAFQNAAFVLDDKNVIQVLIIETSGKKTVDDNS